jgi:uncharacterized membrane protein
VDRREGWTDEQCDIVLAPVLRLRVIASAFVVAIGGIVFLWRHGLERPLYDVFRGELGNLAAVRGIVTEAVHLSGRGLVQLGLLLLVATPIARVVFSVVGFLRQRDWLYVGITMAVLTLLAYSLIEG